MRNTFDAKGKLPESDSELLALSEKMLAEAKTAPFTITEHKKLVWDRGIISPVLSFDGEQSAISTVRALKHAIHCLEDWTITGQERDAKIGDEINTAIADLELILARCEGRI